MPLERPHSDSTILEHTTEKPLVDTEGYDWLLKSKDYRLLNGLRHYTPLLPL